MKTSWLLTLLGLVIGLATLFVSTMSHVARIPPRSDISIATFGAAPARTASASSQEQERVLDATTATPTTSDTAVTLTQMPTQKLAEEQVSQQRSSISSASAAIPPDALVTTSQPVAPAMSPSRAPAAINAAAPEVKVTTQKAKSTPENLSNKRGSEISRSYVLKVAQEIPSAAPDQRSASCNSLSSYLRDLEEQARLTSNEPERVVWIREQRSIVKERQNELRC